MDSSTRDTTPQECGHSHGPIPANVAAYFSESAYVTNDVIDALLELCETDDDKRKLKALGFVRNPYEDSAGVLSFAERKVNLSSIERTFNSFEDTFLVQVKETAARKKEAYLSQVKEAVESKDFEKLATLRPDMGGEVAKQYSDAMKQLFETGKKTASDEMAVVSPETDKDVRGLYRAQALQMEDKIVNEVAVTAQSEALYNVARGAVASYTLEQVEKAVDLKLSKIIQASGTQAMAGAFNTGRLSVFDRYKERIYGFQYTAVIDRRTTNFCLSMNGRVIGPNDADFYRLAPPNHTGCRSFWVEILKDEFIKPAIEGIPDSIPRDRTGLTNFQDLQKIVPYKPKSAATPSETKIQREGVLRQIVKDIREKGVKLKPLPGEIVPPPAPKQEKAGAYEKAKSFDELDKKAAAYFGNIDGSFKHFKDLETGNEILEAIHEVKAKAPALQIPELRLKNVKLKGAVAAMYRTTGYDNVALRFNQKNVLEEVAGIKRGTLAERNAKRIQELEARIAKHQAEAIDESVDEAIRTRAGRLVPVYEGQISKLKAESELWTVDELEEGARIARGTTYHELGHAIENVINSAANKAVKSQQAKEEFKVLYELHQEKTKVMYEIQLEARKNPKILSQYSKTNKAETFAESHSAYMLGHHDRITTGVKAFFDKLYDTLADLNP